NYTSSYVSPSLNSRVYLRYELFSHSRPGKVYSFTCSTAASSAIEAQRAFLKEQKAFERFSSSLHVASVTSPNLTEAAGCKFYWNGGSGEFVATDRAEQTKFHERTFI